MKFDAGFLEQVRSSVNILDVVSQYVNLKKGGQHHIGLCPFHSEKTPSFKVSTSLQIFKCFGCGEGGDVFRFISLLEGLSFPDSVEHLAQRAGIPLPRAGGRQTGQGENRQRLLALMLLAQKHFRQCLKQTPAALDYLVSRQIDEDTIAKFGVGFAPAGNQLRKLLTSRGLSEKQAVRCGLITENEQGDRYDKFRSRIMFPIGDLSGNFIAFGGRILGQGRPKYLNSPETPLYNKSANLYALDLTRDEIRRKDFALLVEGYFDCIVPYQFGFRNVVASLGTALTDLQVKTLARYTRNVVLNYDPDGAGVMAAVRSIETFFKHGLRVNIVQLPEGTDPDTFLRQEGAEAYAQRLRESTSSVDFLLAQSMAAQRDPYSPRGKQQVLDQVLPKLILMPNRIEQSEYASRIAHRLRIDEDLVRLELRRLKRPRRQPRAQTASPHWRQPELLRAEEILLAAALHPDSAQWVKPYLTTDLVEGLRSRAIFAKIIESWELQQEISILYLRKLFDEAAEIQLLDTLHFRTSELPLSQETAKKSVLALRRKQLDRKSVEIQQELTREAASATGSQNRIDELLVMKEKIERQKQRLELN